jgi:succinate dehydrogenase / fumarate reductase cytochrome b subunit
MIDPADFAKNHLDAAGIPNVYYMVVKGFQNYAVSIFYIVAVVLMGFHLNHAIQSAFQSLGINHPKYNPILRGIGPLLAYIVVIGLISLPITIMFRLVGGNL